MGKNRILILALSFILLSASSVLSQAVFEKGLKEFKEENYEEALEYFLQARQIEPKSSSVAFFLGLTYKHMEKFGQAVPYLKDAVTFTPRVKEGLVELIDALTQTDDTTEAKKWIGVGEQESIQPARIQFFKGLILVKENKFLEAIAAFDKSRDLEPALRQQAEFQIANACARLGQWKEARNRLTATISVDPNSDLATFARDYEKQVSEKIEQERPFRFSFGLGYKYDTNVVAMPTSGPVADFISGQRDTALNLTLRAAYTAPFSFRGPFNFAVQYALNTDRYFRRDDYNTMTNVISAIPGYNFTKFSLSMPVTYMYNWLQRSKGSDFLNDFNWFSDTRYMQQVGASPTVRFLLGTSSMGELSAGYADKKYFVDRTRDMEFATDPAENRDGHLVLGSAGWMYFFNEGKGIFNIKYTYSEEKTKGDNWSNTDHRFDVSFLTPIKGPWKVQLSGSAAFTDYDHINSFYDVRRKDNIYNGSIGLIYGLKKNLDVIGQYAYIRDKSNISTYDYEREIFSIGLEYRY
jgi:tetratricopeptide (TPR) repeat protein